MREPTQHYKDFISGKTGFQKPLEKSYDENKHVHWDASLVHDGFKPT